MPVNDTIDVTPPYSVSTVQFESEGVNIFVTSLLAVLILSNIGSMISKCVFFTRGKEFSYDAWVRAFIFANSDDPLTIASWVAGQYVYPHKEWHRKPQKNRLPRAIVPLLARAIIVMSSIASVAITIPGEKRMNGCTKDFELRLNIENARFIEKKSQSVCDSMSFMTRRGTVHSTASYCECPTSGKFPGRDTFLYVSHDEKSALSVIAVGVNDILDGQQLYIEWKEGDGKFTPYRTNIAASLSPARIADMILRKFGDQFNCRRIPNGREEHKNGTKTSILVPVQCNPKEGPLDPTVALEHATSYFWTALEWKDTPQRQIRVEVKGPNDFSPTKFCPISVSITRPIVNIIPLIVGLAIMFLLNIIVSFSIRKHGNALDAGFHIIKEILGHDTTSNPLEEPEDRTEIMEVDLRKWVCSGGGGHIGFIGRHGDVAVENFDENIVLGECTRAAIELGRAKARYGEAVEGSTDSSE